MMKKRIGFIVILTTIVLLASGCTQAKDDLTISTFKNSSRQEKRDIWEPFSKKYDLTIKTEFGNDKERLENSDAGIDIIELLQKDAVAGNKEARFKKLDFSKLKNFGLLSKQQQKIAKETNSIPYQVKRLGVVYNANKVGEIYSWDQLWDAGLESSIAVPNITTELGPQMLYMVQGHYQRKQVTSVFVDTGQLDSKTMFMELNNLKPNILKVYDDPNSLSRMLKSGEIYVAVVDDVTGKKIQKANSDVKFVLPKEDDYIGYKTAAILKNSESDEDYKYLDFLIEKNQNNLKQADNLQMLRKIDYEFLNKHLTSYTKEWNKIIN